MTIQVVRDTSTETGDWEHCCFCFRPSRHWYEPKDVAVCEECAMTRSTSEVPTKSAWLDSVIKRYPHLDTHRWSAKE